MDATGNRLWVTAAALLLAGSMASAQQDAAETVEEPRRYTVEVIVFRYAEAVSTGTEIFVPEPPPAGEPVFSDRPETVATEPEEEPAVPQTGEAFDFVLLRGEEYGLRDTYARLRRLDVYEPVLHAAWTQTTLPEDQTQPIDLQALAEPPAGLEGFFKLYLSRYLHLVVDLTLDAAPDAAVAIDDSVFSYQDARRDNRFGDAPANGPVRYRISENRIFKSGDLRYFDHPKFGVLAKITRVEQEAGDDVEPEMLGYDPDDLPGSPNQ